MVIRIICHWAAIASLFAADVCPRPPAGSEAKPPADLFSANGLLDAALFFRTSVDEYRQTRYCYVTPNGTQAPTLRVKPGDTVVLRLKNEAGPALNATTTGCDAMPMSPLSTNLHFHGLSIPPVCHQDEVLHTGIAPGDPPFEYRFQIPPDQPPGLYWYHPHPHGFVEGQVLGGASGAMVVSGLERFRPEVAGLPERLLVLRDQFQPGQQLNYLEPGEESEKDASLNFVPITIPPTKPAAIVSNGAPREFWRVLNAAADTYFDLQLLAGGQPQPLEMIALDGAPLAKLRPQLNVLLSPGARAEFIVRAQPGSQLVSRRYETGPDGADNPARVLARIVPGSARLPLMPASSRAETPPNSSVPTPRVRRFYLSEDRSDPDDPQYFITQEGARPKVFDMMAGEPDIVVRQGAVEDWIVENRAPESHTFHIHQLHFQLLERDGAALEPLTLDTVDLPFWDGKSAYPSVRLRMDFRSPLIVGTFVFHCHILEHEDAGMMGSIRVEPAR
jgi:hypothetical protein